MRKILRISFITVHVFLFVVSANAQLKTPPKIEWQRSLGGSNDDMVFSMEETTDGGFIVAGKSNSIDDDVVGNRDDYYADSWIVKLTNIGVIEWQKCFGGSYSEQAYSIRQTKDNGYIMAAASNSDDGDVTENHGSFDCWIVKLTNEGMITWQKSLGGSRWDIPSSIIETTDGGYIVAGYSESTDGNVSGHHGGKDTSDYWIVKLTNLGVVEWEKSLGGSRNDKAYSIQQAADGGYIVAGESWSTDGDVSVRQGDYWLVKLSNIGVIEWNKSFGQITSQTGLYIQRTTGSGYIVAGHKGYKYWIAKLDEEGGVEWEKLFGGSNFDYATSIQETADGGYIVAGSCGSKDGDVTGNHGSSDYWVMKLTSIGTLEWQKALGGPYEDAAISIRQTANGYIVAGWCFSATDDITGHHGNVLSSDYWIVKLSPENPSGVEAEPATTHNLSITPNPASTSATLTLDSDGEGACKVEIISITGATLKEYFLHLATGKQEIPLTELESLPAGMYEVLVKRSGCQTLRTKLVVQ